MNLLLLDLTKSISKQILNFEGNLGQELGPTWVIFTKSDLVESPSTLPLSMVIEKTKEVIPSIEGHYCISNKTGENVHLLTGDICDRAESGPHLYTKGEISNKNERFFATEYIREQAFLLLKDELPYEVAVTIEEYRDYKDKNDKDRNVSNISASILVNRPSQRAIVIGSKGSMIKEIGTKARKKIEAMTGGQVHLNLHVKVMPNWFKNNFVLEEIGLPRAIDSNRVWRKRD